MNYTERQRLVSNHSAEPVHPLRVVFNCGVCLGLLILLAWIGSTDGTGGGAQVAHGNPHLSTPATTLNSAAAHRKEVFDARRANFAGDATRRDVVGRSRVDRVDGGTQ